jgi:hypothetical protein
MDPDDPTLSDQPGRRLFKSVFAESYGVQGFLPGKKVESLSLPGIYPGWQISIFFALVDPKLDQ